MVKCGVLFEVRTNFFIIKTSVSLRINYHNSENTCDRLRRFRSWISTMICESFVLWSIRPHCETAAVTNTQSVMTFVFCSQSLWALPDVPRTLSARPGELEDRTKPNSRRIIEQSFVTAGRSLGRRHCSRGEREVCVGSHLEGPQMHSLDEWNSSSTVRWTLHLLRNQNWSRSSSK
jgi:hypothetical protein